MMSPFHAVAERVIDGDTVWLRIRVRTRKSTPSNATEDGKAATYALKRLLPRGRKVWVEPITTDQFGRIVATISTTPMGGRDRKSVV